MFKPGQIPLTTLSRRQRAVILEEAVKLDPETGLYIKRCTTTRTWELKAVYDGMVAGKIPLDPARVQTIVDGITAERIFRSGTWEGGAE